MKEGGLNMNFIAKDEMDGFSLLRFENQQLSNELKAALQENKELRAKVKQLEGELFMNSYYKDKTQSEGLK